MADRSRLGKAGVVTLLLLLLATTMPTGVAEEDADEKAARALAQKTLDAYRKKVHCLVGAGVQKASLSIRVVNYRDGKFRSRAFDRYRWEDGSGRLEKGEKSPLVDDDDLVPFFKGRIEAGAYSFATATRGRDGVIVVHVLDEETTKLDLVFDSKGLLAEERHTGPWSSSVTTFTHTVVGDTTVLSGRSRRWESSDGSAFDEHVKHTWSDEGKYVHPVKTVLEHESDGSVPWRQVLEYRKWKFDDDVR